MSKSVVRALVAVAMAVLFVGISRVDAQTYRARHVNRTASPEAAINYISHQSGNWNDPATWDIDTGGGMVIPAVAFPAVGDNATIQGGHHVTLTGNDTITNLVNNGFIQGSGNLSISGNFTDAFFNNSTGTFTFNGVGNTQTILGSLFQNLVIANVGGTVTSNGIFATNLDVQTGTYSPGNGASFGNVQIDAAGTLNAPAGNIGVNFNWSNHGTFVANGGTVNLAGDQPGGMITGNTTFAGLVLTNGIVGRLTFEAGSTQTVTTALSIQGPTIPQFYPFVLVSSVPGTRWKINLQNGATQSIANVNVRDSDASGGQTLHAQGTSFDGGNNVNWDGFSTTAATVTVSGRVLNAAGRGATNTFVVLSDASGTRSTIRTGRGGAFTFTGVESGRTYTVSASSATAAYASQVVSVNDNVAGLEFRP